MPSFVLGLVWRNPDSTCTEEPWQYFDRESFEAALAAARRDGVAGELGRTFLGVATVQKASEWEPWPSRPLDPARAPSRAELDAQLAAANIDLARWAEPARSGPSLECIERVPWWRYECAFGTGTMVGVELRRCLAVDPEVAAASAELVGECIAHQMTIWSAAPAAVGAIAQILEQPSCSPRRILADWLEVVAKQSAKPVPDEPEDVARKKLTKTLQKGGTPAFLIDGLVERGIRHDSAVRACREAFAAHAAAFERLGRAGLVGKATKKLVQSLAR